MSLQVEIHNGARLLLGAMKKPDGQWMINVIKSSQQGYVWLVCLDRIIREPGHSECFSGKFAIHETEWKSLSDVERIFLLSQRLAETIAEISEQVNAHANV